MKALGAQEDAVTGRDVSVLTVGVTTEQEPGTWRVTVRGEVDLVTAPALASRLFQVLDHAEVLLLDLADVAFMDASGVSVLLRVRTASLAANRSFVITTAHPAVLRVLDILQLTDLLPTRPPGFRTHRQ